MERPHDGASARPSAYASQGNVGSVGNRSDKDKRLACLTSRQQRSRPLSPGFVLLRSLSVPLPFAESSPADGADQGCNSDACFVSVESLLNRRKWIRGFSRRRAGWSRRKGLNCSGRHNLGAINFRCPKIPQNSGACWTRTSDQRIMSPPL